MDVVESQLVNECLRKLTPESEEQKRKMTEAYI